MARVLFMTPWYPSRRDPMHGTFVEEHARAAAREHDVRVLVVDVGPTGRPNGGFGFDVDAERRSGIATYRLEFARSRFRLITLGKTLAWVAYGVLRIRRSGFRPELLHANVLDVGVPAALASAVLRIPLVFTEHYSVYPRRALSRFGRAQAWLTTRWARCVMPVSQSLRDAMRDYGLEARYEIVPNAVDPDRFHAEDDGDRDLVLFVARLEEVKDPLAFLRAVAVLDQRGVVVQAVVVGSGSLEDACRAFVRDEGLGGTVEVLGERAKGDVATLMRRARCLVLTSRYENLPCVALEALVSGALVVGPPVGGVPEIVDHPQLGRLVDVRNTQALADALEPIIDGSETIDHRAVAALALDRYSTSAVGRQLSEIYGRVLGGVPQRADV